MSLLLLSLNPRVAGYLLQGGRRRGLEEEGGQHDQDKQKAARDAAGMQAGVWSPGPCVPGPVKPCKAQSLAKAHTAFFSPQGLRQAGKQTGHLGEAQTPRREGEASGGEKPSSGSPQGQNNWLIESIRPTHWSSQWGRNQNPSQIYYLAVCHQAKI